jgi:hypothetical protein
LRITMQLSCLLRFRRLQCRTSLPLPSNSMVEI